MNSKMTGSNTVEIIHGVVLAKEAGNIDDSVVDTVIYTPTIIL
jgi:hypothetical protein